MSVTPSTVRATASLASVSSRRPLIEQSLRLRHPAAASWRAMSIDAQQKVQSLQRCVSPENTLTIIPAAVGASPESRSNRLRNHREGKEATEALYQPHSVGEFHISGRPRCARKCDAKYAKETQWIGGTHKLMRLQTNIPRDTLAHATMVAMSTSIRPSHCARSERLPLSVFRQRSGVSMFSVSMFDSPSMA